MLHNVSVLVFAIPLLVDGTLGIPMENEKSIETLINLGPKSSQWLRDAGITTIGELERIGSVAAYRRVKRQQPKASLNLLWALEAGLRGQDWRMLSEALKNQLREEVDK